MRYLLIVFLLMIAVTACKNRFEEYEPYSAFDERMAAEAQPTMSSEYETSANSETYDSYSYDDSYQQTAPVKTDAEKRAAAQSQALADTGEIPFDDTRGQKHAANIGEM